MSKPRRIPDMRPGDPAWIKVVSASKIAAVVGLSPYESRYSLWHLMAGNTEPEPNNAIFERGHYLEPAIAQWFADQSHTDDRLPGFSVRPTGTFTHETRHQHVASPDRMLYATEKARKALGLLEIKSALNEWEWGQTGTDEIPIGYRCQVQWQLHVMDLPVAYVAAITSHLEFRWYRIERDQGDIDYLIEQADLFLQSIADGIEPDVDSSEHTYAAIRELHPDIDGRTVELEPGTAIAYVHALRAEREAKAAKQDAVNHIAHEMGTAQHATYAGMTYAHRQSRGGGKPFVVADRGLTSKEQAA